MRTLIESLEAQFAHIDARQRSLLQRIPDEKLFWTLVPATDTLITLSVGGAILRSAAKIEQAFLGLTRRLWDDPFEWTLPEKLSSRKAIAEYLNEVVTTRTAGMAFLTSDADLSRLLPAPEELKPVFKVLIESVAEAENFLGRGEAIFKLLAAQARSAR